MLLLAQGRAQRRPVYAQLERGDSCQQQRGDAPPDALGTCGQTSIFGDTQVCKSASLAPLPPPPEAAAAAVRCSG